MHSVNPKSKKRQKKHIPLQAYLTVVFVALLLIFAVIAFLPDRSGVLRESPSSEKESTSESIPERESSSEKKEASSEIASKESDAVSQTETSDASEASAETSASAVSEATESTSSEEKITLGDVVFIGDSRTLSMGTGGSLEYALIPDDSICATWGGQLPDETSFTNARNAAAKRRKKAVFWFGINDVQMNPERDDENVFLRNYIQVLNAYLENWSGSEIYIVSVLSTSVNERDYYEGQEANILKYNEALCTLCLENGYTFVDVSDLFTGEDCLAPGDNIHFSKEWYEQKYLPAIKKVLGIE